LRAYARHRRRLLLSTTAALPSNCLEADKLAAQLTRAPG